MRIRLTRFPNKDRFQTSVLFIITFILFTGILEAICTQGIVPPYIIPAPSAIAARLIQTVSIMAGEAATTSLEIAVGFVVGAVGGIVLAAVIVSSSFIEKLVYPWLVILQVIPKIALGPLLLIWLGFGLFPKIVLSFLLAFFPIMIDSIIGMRSVDKDSIDLLRSMGSSKLGIFRYLQLPTALPYIFGSFKVGMTLAVVGAIVGEFLGGQNGLGHVLIVANGNLDTTLLFVSLLWICAIALVFYAVVIVAEKGFVWWHVSQR